MTTYQVVNPATGVAGRRYPTASDADIAAAVSAAHTAFGRSPATSLAQRLPTGLGAPSSDPAAELVVVKFSTHPVPNTAFTHALDRQAFAALAKAVR